MCAILHAETYYLSPSGDNGNSGTATTTAWATLQYAEDMLQPGDTLLVMGGTYSTQQYMWGGPSGTEGNPIVLKAYGDGVAYFQRGGSNGVFFVLTASWFVIDGQSYLNGGDAQRYLVFQSGAYDGMASNYAYSCITGASARHVTIHKAEFSGLYCGHSNAPGDYSAAWLYNGFILDQCEYWEITNCHIHHVGDSTWTYGSGYPFFADNCRFLLLENNELDHGGHGMVELRNSQYCIVRGNRLTNYWGGGIYLYIGTAYNLIEDNLILHSGTSYGDGMDPDYPKPCVQLSASRNVFRNNVLYTPFNQGFDFEAYGNVDNVDSNLVYNNTIYNSKWGYGNMILQVRTAGRTCEDNLIANNIIYKSIGWGGGTACNSTNVPHASPEILITMPYADDNGNWLEPDEYGVLPHSTHFGGNRFAHNLLRHYSSTADYDSMITYSGDMDYRDYCRRWTVADLEALDPVAWYGNISDNPRFVSEDPEVYGLTSGWWHLQPGSSCIDGGIVVDDWIGAYVESLHPGYGWGNRSYVGAAPDIGAYEHGEDVTGPPGPPSLEIHPGSK